MSTAKHTPGPWEYDASTQRVHGPRFRLVAWMKPHADSEEVRANGSLIAAAPELLEALKGLLEATPEEECEAACTGDNCPWLQARAIIARAEGRP